VTRLSFRLSARSVLIAAGVLIAALAFVGYSQRLREYR